MKRIICFLTLIICFCMTPIQAQKKMMSQEEFRKQQQMFLTERAGLTPEEAKNFKTRNVPTTKKHGRNSEKGKKPVLQKLNTTES